MPAEYTRAFAHGQAPGQDILHIVQRCKCHTTVLSMMVAGLLGASVAHGKPSLSANLALGYGYDSNVSVDEIESQSGEADRFRSTDAQVDISDTIGGVSGTLTYAYSSSDYEDFDNVSRTTQTLGASLDTAIGKTRIGLSYFEADADLADEEFLSYQRFSPHISGFVSRRWFLRGAAVTSEKSIVNRPARSSESEAIEIDGYYFWRGLRRYFNIGYAYEEEDAAANRYDYRGHLFKLRMIQRFAFNDSLGSLELGVRYETRDYIGITPQIRDARDDQRTRVRAELSLPLTERVHWRLYARYGNYLSNLESVDYEEAVIGTQIELRF